MKTDIHPIYHDAAAVTCSCGAAFTVGSTLPKLHIEICSVCHPFFSGQDKILDTAGRVEKFKKRRVKSTEISATKKPKKPRVKSNAKISHGVGDLSGQS
jgi:large subunit ribosomal protein L31